MSKILIVYGSSTGNTESIAEKLGRVFKDAGHEAVVRNAGDVSAAGLASGYDAVLFGCSAWGLDTLEMQEDFAPLMDEFGSMGLQGVKVAAFASGDSSYEYYCGAIPAIEEQAADAGAVMIGESLCVEGDAAAAGGDLDDFAAKVMAAL